MSAQQAIDAARAAGGAAFVGYLPVGFPSLDGSIAAARELAAAGADIIEVGIPYSDPSMDGGVIQEATSRALASGSRVADVFTMVEAIANEGTVPLVMTYYNLVFKYGVDAFARDLASAGGAGLITPDLIPDEAQAWMAASDAHGLDRIFLVAQSSTDERLRLTAKASRGFVYAASTMGVTGERASLDERARQLVARTRGAGAERVCVGIGVTTPGHAAEVANYADGVIVGSALIRPLLQDGTAGLRAMREVAESLARATHGAAQ
ncbi:MAG: tryptophan synthase subunit alpha [Actinomycetaceae bacterium]|nr:tryptophan synthase subunit alpha [Actinomycetaceae bacterium]